MEKRQKNFDQVLAKPFQIRGSGVRFLFTGGRYLCLHQKWVAKPASYMRFQEGRCMAKIRLSVPVTLTRKANAEMESP